MILTILQQLSQLLTTCLQKSCGTVSRILVVDVRSPNHDKLVLFFDANPINQIDPKIGRISAKDANKNHGSKVKIMDKINSRKGTWHYF